MNKSEAILASAYTGFLFPGINFSDVHKLIEEKLDRPVFTHDIASDDFMKEVRRSLLADFTGMVVTNE